MLARAPKRLGSLVSMCKALQESLHWALYDACLTVLRRVARLTRSGLQCFYRSMGRSHPRGVPDRQLNSRPADPPSVSYASLLLDHGSRQRGQNRSQQEGKDPALRPSSDRDLAMHACLAPAQALLELGARRLVERIASGPHRDEFIGPDLNQRAVELVH